MGPSEESDANGTVQEVMHSLRLAPELITEDIMQHLPVRERINITAQVWSQLRYAIERLKMAIKEENQQSEVAVIRSTVCSFTRGVMIRGSDIDELYIYLHGVDEDRMNYYAVQFAGWFAMGAKPRGFKRVSSIKALCAFKGS